MVFAGKRRKQLAEEFPGTTFGDISKIVGQEVRLFICKSHITVTKINLDSPTLTEFSISEDEKSKFFLLKFDFVFCLLL